MVLERLLDLLPIGAVVVSRDGTVRHANRHVLSLFGYQPSELIGHPLGILLPEEVRVKHEQFVRAWFTRPVGRGMHTGRVFVARRKNGARFPADISLTRVADGGEEYGLACLIDVTTLHTLGRVQRALAFLSGSNRILLRSTGGDVILQDVCRLATETGGYRLAWIGEAQALEGKPVRVLARAGQAVDYMEALSVSWAEDPLGYGPTGRAIVHARPIVCRFIRSDPAFAPWRERALAHGIESAAALPLKVDGRVFGALSLYADVPDAFDGDELRLLVEVADDVSFGVETLRLREAHRRAEAQLRRSARVDAVTQVANRAGLSAFLEEEIHRGRGGALIFVNLRRFKEINHTQGYAMGDAVLKASAHRLAGILTPGEQLARIGGSEFALAVPEGDEAAARRAAERIRNALAEKLLVDGLSVSLGVKVGVARYPAGRATPDEVYADAGLAAQFADPESGGIRFYSPAMSSAFARRLDIARRLQAALREEALALFYQPKVDIASGRLVGAEALLRWNDAVLGAVPPDQFIPVAEERGLMPELGNWVIASACRQLLSWQDAGLRFPGRVSVNVSVAQFNVPDFAATAARIVEAAGASAADLELELTESLFVGDGPATIEAMKTLTAKGFALAIDDFGTGFSSLAYLSRLPAGTLKIDVSFVRNMLESPNDHVVVRAIIGMARSLGMDLVAEGVESAAHAQALLDLGCPTAQGYHYGHPEPAEPFARRWLAGGGRFPAAER
ncbi:MAG: EAL domain-containing protein [Betaproteobacteria bacterium]|nr:EAL domain-containing protein [Betaproteobacteria bacterium]